MAGIHAASALAGWAGLAGGGGGGGLTARMQQSLGHYGRRAPSNVFNTPPPPLPPLHLCCVRPSVRGGGDAPVTIETRPHQVSHDKHGGVVHTHIRVAKEKKKPELHFGLLPHESQSVNHTHTHLDNSSADTYGNEYANKLIIAQKARMIKDEMK